jgi:anti-sigma B factor antagonist
MSDFTCRTERLAGSDAVIVRAGEIDLYTSDHLKTVLAGVLQDDPSARVVIDLSDVPFIDSAGFGVLINHYRQATEQTRIVVTRADIRRLFALTGLEKVFTIHASRAEAIASLT